MAQRFSGKRLALLAFVLCAEIGKILLNINRTDFLQNSAFEILVYHARHVLIKGYGVRLVVLTTHLQSKPCIIHKRHKIIPPLIGR